MFATVRHGKVIGASMAAAALALSIAAVTPLVGAVAATTTGTSTTTTTATTATPTSSQVKTAVTKAEKASTLWATINACQQSGSKDALIGLRGQMPALGFPATLKMVLTAYYYSSTGHRYDLVKGSSRALSLGTVTSGTVQSGIEYTITTPVTVIGKVDFEWFYNGKLVGSVVRKTSGGHSKVKHSTPAGYNVATCSIT